jgi:hypothetical protein
MFDRIVVIDKTQTTPIPQTLSPDRPRAFIPIFSSKGFGKDSTIKLFNANSQGSLVSSYGQPDIVKNLAPQYYAYEALRGGADVYIRRIVSSTASFSHAVIVGKSRTGTGLNTAKKEIVFEIHMLPDSANLDQMVSDAEALATTVADADGYISSPIAIIGLNWAGKEGDKYTFRLIPNRSLDKQISQKAYQLEIRESSTSSPTTVSFSLDLNTLLDGQSLYADDIFDEQSPNVFFKVLAGYTTFVETVAAKLPAGEVSNPDIFFGTDKAGVLYPNYVILTGSSAFTAVGGISFAGGGDGDFAIGVGNRIANMETRYIASFSEDDTRILENEYRYFIDYVFDFGASDTVKDAIVAFASRRKTTKAIIDTGTTDKTVTAIVTDRTTGNLTYDNSAIVLVGGIGTYRDPFTNKKIVMPLSFFEAFAVPNHIITFESGARPFAGSSYTYKNIIPGTYLPYIYDEDGVAAESLRDNQLNFAFEDTNGYQAFHQSTSLKTKSVLQERNNIHILHLMIRSCLLEAKAERWNFAEDSDIERYSNRINQRLKTEMDGKVGELSLQAARAGLYGDDRNRVNVDITVRFKFINEGTTFTFNVV